MWGVCNKGGEPSHLMINLPTDSYNKNAPEQAEADASNYSVYSVPKQFQGVGFLIARFTYQLEANGTDWTLYATEDLRGKIPNTTAGGGAGGAGVTEILGLLDTPSAYTDEAGRVLAVNAGKTAMEFTDTPALQITHVLQSDPTVALTTGDGKLLFTCPAHLDGYKLTDAHAVVYTPSSSGRPTIQIQNTDNSEDLLNTPITIEPGDNTSYSADTAPVHNDGQDVMNPGFILRVDVDVAGTDAEGLEIHLVFSKEG